MQYDDMRYDALALDRSSSVPLYQQLVDALVRAIVARELAIGQRLLAERKLAALLHVSRNTVMTCYRELEARGLVHRHVGLGSFVAAEPEPTEFGIAWQNKLGVETHQPTLPPIFSLTRDLIRGDAVSFAIGQPALECFPIDLFATAYDQVMTRSPLLALAYGPVEGMPELRLALADRFGLRSDRTMVVSGGRQGLDLMGQAFIDPGDAVIIDRPGFRGTIEVFNAYGAQLIGWDIRKADFTELEDLILRFRPKLLYTNPTYSNPTGVVLSLEQRQTLLDLVGRYRLPIIEDEPYRLLPFEKSPPPSLHQMDKHELVIHLGTFSKTLAPGLRLGWVSGPPVILHQLALVKQRRDLSTPNLTQLMVAEAIRSREFDRYLSVLRAEHLARFRALLSAIAALLPPAALRFSRPAGGLYLWCKLGYGLTANQLLEVAARHGVVFAAGGLFYADGGGEHEIRLCFGSTSPTQIRQGVRRLADALTEVRGGSPSAG